MVGYFLADSADSSAALAVVTIAGSFLVFGQQAEIVTILCFQAWLLDQQFRVHSGFSIAPRADWNLLDPRG